MSSVPPPPFPATGEELSPAGEPVQGPPRWPWWTAPLALLLALAGALFGAILINVVASLAGLDISTEHTPGGVNLAATYFQDACFVLAALYFARTIARPRPVHFGLRPVRVGPAIGWLVGIWVAFLGASQGIAAVIDPPKVSQDQVLRSLGVNGSQVGAVLAIVLVCAVAPVVEEFLFRGYIFPALRTAMPLVAAALLDGLIFGSIHVTNYIHEDFSYALAAVLSLVILGFGLCLLYWRTGSLLPCIGLHALNNAIAFGVSQHWTALQVIALFAGSLVAMGLVVVPLARRAPRSSGRLARGATHA